MELLEIMLGGLSLLEGDGTYLKYEWYSKKKSGGFDGPDFKRADEHRRVQTKNGQRARADTLG